MINQWLVTGDTHGEFSRFYKVQELAAAANEIWGIIILGDSGFNFWLSKRDKQTKYRVCDKYPNLRFYCVRGNHECRPENLDSMRNKYDEEVSGYVWHEPNYPNIAYLCDGHDYNINGYTCIAIGGAYSVDKYYRLERQAAGYYSGWFADEQLSEEERKTISAKVKGKHYNFILTHTCPWSWQPRDLFLSCIDQSKVDDSMEIWLDELKETCDWDAWLAGHYHDDRTLAPHAQMLMHDIKNLSDIYNYWNDIKEENC